MGRHVTLLGKDPEALNINAFKKDLWKTLDAAVRDVRTKDVVTAPPFENLFPIKAEILEAVTKSMIASGFDRSQPIIFWKEKNVLIDGHTRLKAAKAAGVSSMPAVFASFAREEEVIKYMSRLQFHRRNVTDSDLIKLVIKALPRYEKRYGQGSKARFLTGMFSGLTETKAKQAAMVAEKAEAAALERIAQGKTTIRKVYETLKKNGQKRNEKVTCDDLQIVKKIWRISFDKDGRFFCQNPFTVSETAVFILPDFLNKDAFKIKLQKLIMKETARRK